MQEQKYRSLQNVLGPGASKWEAYVHWCVPIGAGEAEEKVE